MFKIAILGVMIAAIGGWIANLVKLVGLFGETLEANAIEAIIRGIGVFAAPLGAILGYF